MTMTSADLSEVEPFLLAISLSETICSLSKPKEDIDRRNEKSNFVQSPLLRKPIKVFHNLSAHVVMTFHSPNTL